MKEQRGWHIVNDIYLGLFSFTKFIMYKDLEAFADNFSENALIRAICGDEVPEVKRDLFPDSKTIDAVLVPQSTFQILDADSSQQEAILAVTKGASLVLEGPPGTGKSQTIEPLGITPFDAMSRSTMLEDTVEVIASLSDMFAWTREQRREIRNAEERSALLFGSQWRQEESDPEDLERFATWMRRFRPHLLAGDAEELLKLAVGGLSRPEEALEEKTRLEERIQAFVESWKRLSETARLAEHETLEGDLEDHSFDALHERLKKMAENMEALHDWGHRVAAREICRQASLEVFLVEADKKGVPPGELMPAFDRLFLRTCLDHAFQARPELRLSNRQEHEQTIHEFRELDLEQLNLARKRLRHKLLASLPDASWEASARSELEILQREIRRKQGHMLRKLF